MHTMKEIYVNHLAECGKTATDLDEILDGKTETENSYTKMFKKNLDFIVYLQIFGEMGIVLTHTQMRYKSKGYFCGIRNRSRL